jgi:hypothetical protein
LILRIVEPSSGDRDGQERNVRAMSRLALKQYLSEVRLIFQDPFASLNPRMTVKRIVGDPLYVNDIAPGRAREDRVAELLRLVGLDPDTTDRYPLAFPAASASASASPAPSRSSPHHHRRRGQSARSAHRSSTSCPTSSAGDPDKLYTWALVSAVPSPDPRHKRMLRRVRYTS